MVGSDPAQTTDLVVRALRLAGQRGILLSGWARLGGTDLPEDVYSVDAIPHDWLFPRVAAVVHHGGAGTTAAGLRAGVPNVITPFTTSPFFGDQLFWGQRIHRLGVGPSRRGDRPVAPTCRSQLLLATGFPPTGPSPPGGGSYGTGPARRRLLRDRTY